MSAVESAGAESKLTLGYLLRQGLKRHPGDYRLCAHHSKVFGALMACGTGALGAHFYQCNQCGRTHPIANACRDRHCPSCQAAQSHQWLEKQQATLLPIPYFHVVFTLPHEFNALIRQNQSKLYGLLFKVAASVLLEFGRNNLGVQLGITMVLHSWNQQLMHHVHTHCIVSGGGLTLDGKGWKSSSQNYLFPKKAVRKVFRARFCERLQELYYAGELEFHGQLKALAEEKAFQGLIAKANTHPWHLHFKAPFSGPGAVLNYLSRYTHRFGITNKRLLDFDPVKQKVTFQYLDRTKEPWTKATMRLDLKEFIARLQAHILPNRFFKIRHYGFLSNRYRKVKVALARELLAQSPEALELEESNDQTSKAYQDYEPSLMCPFCGAKELVLVGVVRTPVDLSAPMIWDSS